MNHLAYRTTGFAIKMLSNLSRARVRLHGLENLSDGPRIFVINHFTRIETLLLPYHINRQIQKPVWSLAAADLFVGALGEFLDTVGSVSTRNPDRDRLMVKTLLTGEADWIIFPEGRMVKSKKIIEKGRFMISYAGGKRPPHTGAAILAMRTEFYRQRLRHLVKTAPQEAERLAGLFELGALDTVSQEGTSLVPVNITYYPIRAKENTLNKLATWMMGKVPERMNEELMIEGSMLLSGVDIDIRFGRPIAVAPCIDCRPIRRDVTTTRALNFDDPLPSMGRMRKEALKLMQRYMAAIYALTTVNHDHLFATALKMNPTARADSANLKRRVFLAASRKRRRLRSHLHHSLRTDQVHLLTDDRYGKYEEFLRLAVESGVVVPDNEVLHIERKRFGSALDFDRVRIDNPIAVIANEVEPLKDFLRRLRRLSWQPSWWLRRRVVRHLLHYDLRLFEKDYDRWAQPEMAKPMEVGRPLLLKGRSRRLGVVLSHGYMAAPMEVAELATYLCGKGLWVYVPRLRGHGTDPTDLAGRSYPEWIEDMDRGYALMRNLCRNVVAGGFSTGAGLALDLGHRVEELAGIFAISAPLRLQDLSSRFVPAVDAWNWFMEKVRLNEAKKEFVENHPENPHINYHLNPISGVHELERLMADLEPRLGEIQKPALVAQANGDPVVNPKGAEMIFERLGSADKQLLMFNFDRHGILLGEGAQQVYEAVWQFVARLDLP
ncbi:MAG: alpha/beta fold hydrolase [Desulfosarcinaceae bacterium]|nr:alpha/beta fold hydrolase [Desulfosarcinaceae bacterium]